MKVQQFGRAALLWVRKASLLAALAGGAVAGPGVLPTHAQSTGTVTYSGPITITSGGTYRGNWQSTDSNTPAVTINTTQPVVIENSNIRSAGTLIKSHVVGGDVTVRNTSGYATRPTQDNVNMGRFLACSSIKNLRVEHCYLEQTSGIVVDGYSGDHTANQTVKLYYNKAVNLDGRTRNGGGWTAQFVQFIGVRGIRGVDVAWNEIINTPGNSFVEDNVNIYKSYGTSDSPILIHDNYVQGAYPVVPTNSGHSGGGLMLGDGDPTSLADAPGHVKCYNNQVVNVVHYGIAVANGHDIEVYNNRVVHSGVINDSQYLQSSNVGMYSVNGLDNNANTTALFFNISFHDNQIGYTKRLGWTDRNDTWFRNIHVNQNNVALPGPITPQTEQNELAAWRQKLQANNLTVGVVGGNTGGGTGGTGGGSTGGGSTGGTVAGGGLGTGAPPAGSTFYRAINVAGAALTLDNRTWESSWSAPNQTVTGTPFANQNVTLNPSTDASRTSMIRSSVFGTTAGLTLSSVPTGTYSVFVYVWEDNAAATFSVQVNGQTVQSNVNSGGAGAWSRLGPYAATVTGGTLAVLATGTGDANVSGVEVWSVPTSNTPPTVALTGPAGGATLAVSQAHTLTATAADANGSVTKVEFFAGSTKVGEDLSAPYQLAWTPTATGAVSLTARATDNAGASTTSAAVAVQVTAPVATFYRGINLAGQAAAIDGRTWESSWNAPNFTVSGTPFANQNVPLTPATDADRATMIRSSYFSTNLSCQLSSVPAGNYDVYLYVWEDNSPTTFSVQVNGQTVVTNRNSGAAGTWAKLGPFNTTVTGGTLSITTTGGDANLSGVEVWNKGAALSTKKASAARLSVFPNPVQRALRVAAAADKTETATATLLDDAGRVVQHTSVAFRAGATEHATALNPATLRPGNYVLRFTSGAFAGASAKVRK